MTGWLVEGVYCRGGDVVQWWGGAWRLMNRLWGGGDGARVWCWSQVLDVMTGSRLTPYTILGTSGRKLGVCLGVRRRQVELVASVTGGTQSSADGLVGLSRYRGR